MHKKSGTTTWLDIDETIIHDTHHKVSKRQAACYFTNFEISKSSLEHTCKMPKLAQKSKKWPKIAKNEVAPSSQVQGTPLMKVENESLKNPILGVEFFILDQK